MLEALPPVPVMLSSSDAGPCQLSAASSRSPGGPGTCPESRPFPDPPADEWAELWLWPVGGGWGRVSGSTQATLAVSPPSVLFRVELLLDSLTGLPMTEFKTDLSVHL